MTIPRRRAAALTVAALAVALLAGCTGPSPEPQATPEPVTAEAVHTTLVDELRLTGQLTFGEAVPLPAVDAMLTVLPVAGAVVGLGEQVFEADGEPVVLFRGERPFWRDLSVDASDGVDVLQLEENLAALGFLRRTPGQRFDWRTREAVRAWQQAIGVAGTGEFLATSVVVVDAPSIRVDQVTAHLGDAGVSPATVGAATLHVTANLTEAQARELVAGTPVTVTLRDGTEIGAALTTVDPGGLPTDDGGTVPPGATIALADDDPELVVALDAVGPSPVRVVVHDDGAAPATLVVPATALLATPGGGYAVEVWDGVTAVVVPVEIGLAADARVQILGGDLAAGDLVVLAR